MRFATVLVLLLAICGADVQATRAATWRLTYAVRGWTGTIGATAQGQAWALLQHGRQQISSTMLRWDGASWRTTALPKGVSAHNARFAASPSGDDLWMFSGDRPFQLTGGRWVPRPWTSKYERGSVAVGAKDDVWISEHGGPDDYSGSGLSHWDGHSWKPVPKPSPYGDLDQISLVAAPDGGETWALIHPPGATTAIRRNPQRGQRPPDARRDAEGGSPLKP